jgi:hypothetical protein
MGGSITILFERIFDPKDLAQGLANFFKISVQDVYLAGHKSIANITGDQKAVLYLDYDIIGRDFPMQCYVSTMATLPDPNELDVLRSLCQHLSCQALIEAQHPWLDKGKQSVQWLITAEGEVYRVELQPDPLEQEPPCYIIDETQEMQRIDTESAAE